MIAVPEKCALGVSSPTPITSGRQHEEYLSVLDKLASKDNPTSEEEKSAFPFWLVLGAASLQTPG
jgi:hypothetical protein